MSYRICRVYLIYLIMDSLIVHLLVTVQNKKYTSGAHSGAAVLFGGLLQHPEEGTTIINRNAVNPSPIDTALHPLRHSSVHNCPGAPKWVPKALVEGRVNAAWA